jgi:hypothetical protein
MKNNIILAILALLMLGLLIVLGPVDQEPEQVSKADCVWVKQTDGAEICK